MKRDNHCLTAKVCCDRYFFNDRKLHSRILTLGIFLSMLFGQQIVDAQVQYMQFEGIWRGYEVHTPQDFQANMPLVIVLHGWSGSIEVQKVWSATHQYADTAGFVVVYVQGIDNSWNFGVEYCPIRGYLPIVNDVGFISALMDTVCNQYAIDMQRIYCVGWSTGGEMAHRLACQLGHRLAAIASVGGGLFDAAEEWYPVKAMPVMEIHGTQDLLFQYNGPNTYNIKYTQSEEEWSMKETLQFWIERNQCDPIGDTVDMPNLVWEDACIAQKITYGSGIDNSEVVHFKIINGGHSWPGSPSTYPFFGDEGNRNMDIDANVEILNFFKKHINSYEVKVNEKGINNSNIKVYPNPAFNIITIESITPNPSCIEVTSHNGQLILSKEMKGTIHQLDLSPFQKGVYFITIRSKDFVITRKMIKL